MDAVLEQKSVNQITSLLSILSKKDAFSIFLLAKDGLKGETDTPQRIGLTRKQYYTRLKQLVDTGLIDKNGDTYYHTSLGSLFFQRHLVELLDYLKNEKQMKMVDMLKQTKQFSENDIASFVGKVCGKALSTSVSLKIEIAWSYEDMVSAIIERTEFCKNEILLATRFLNEVIINNILRKAKSGVNVKVLADVSLVKQYIELENRQLAMIDKNTVERLNVVGNPWYPGNVSRRLAKIPFCMIMIDGKEVGVELVDWNDPAKFNGVLFIKDENSCASMMDFYNRLWNNASEDLTKVLENVDGNVAHVVGSKFMEKMQQ
jgi:hypothetical protein